MCRYFLLVLLMVLGFQTASAADDSMSPVGQWKTVDDTTGRVQAIMEIKEQPDHTLAGTLVKTFPAPGSPPGGHVCSKCDKNDPRFNQPILGMTVMNNFKNTGEFWTDGTILDPMRGAVYRSRLKVVEEGKKLLVRGFILFPLLGRTQTWIRVT
jgi:uncharacterized protein (DUF2147 family)